MSVAELPVLALYVEPLSASVDDDASEAYCRIVCDIAALTLRSRDRSASASTANLLWQTMIATGTHRTTCWQRCRQSIRRLLDDFQATGGVRESDVLGAYARLKAFASEAAQPSLDIAETWLPTVSVRFAAKPAPSRRHLTRRERVRQRSANQPQLLAGGAGDE